MSISTNSKSGWLRTTSIAATGPSALNTVYSLRSSNSVSVTRMALSSSTIKIIFLFFCKDTTFFLFIDAYLFFSFELLHIAHHHAVAFFQSTEHFHIVVVAFAETDGARYEGVGILMNK